MTRRLTEEIHIAHRQLKAFEASTTDWVALARLRAAQPWHPLLMSYRALKVLTVMSGTVALLSVVAPLVSDDALRFVASSSVAMLLPGMTLAATVAFGIACLAMRQATITAGRTSPMLPGERRQHLKLVQTHRRLSAERRLQRRAAAMREVAFAS
jgi:hypothetical protein